MGVSPSSEFTPGRLESQVPHFEQERNIRRGTEFFGLNKKKIAMTAASIRSQLLYAVQEAKAAVERVPRPETYRALLESQSDLQQHDLEYGRKTLRSDPPSRKMVAPRRGRR
jgi:hypothetical protein